MRIGIDGLLSEPRRYLTGGPVALLGNQASLTGAGRPVLEALRELPGSGLCALLSPEHGWSGFEEDASPVGDARDPRSGLVIHSLYGPRRRPDPAFLQGLEAVVVDIQEVGVRCYTYAATVALLLEAARETGTKVIVCDRPNLLGPTIAGPPLEPQHRSFLGYLDLPFQHGLTLGELARLHAATALAGEVDLEVVPLTGWRRGDPPPGPWIPPSPGLPTRDAVALYPGMVLLEGTNASEGRGTPLPFVLLGAPWLEGYRLARELTELRLPGLLFRPLTFRPDSGKLRGRVCHGVQLHVVDGTALRPLAAGLRILGRLLRYPEFEWAANAGMPWGSRAPGAGVADEPREGLLVDYLLGTSAVRAALEARADPTALESGWRHAHLAFLDQARPHLLYEPEPRPA